jgi:hypothetical protein
MDILKEQLELVQNKWPEMLTKPKQEATNEIILAMVGELSELMEGYKALPWKPDRLERDYILEEIVDLHHFVSELYLIWGVKTTEEVNALYFKKKTKNLNMRGKIHYTESNPL